ncbi:ABC transporter permease [Mycolicibacterium sp. P9-22]|uniref:ABC transporter permease n=1 Tax=Mycolicibacterium sp. P9-22 TaxID=2024613 RepID=UPI0011EBA43C|nr:ABC transporter permease [Mycolicibacterium sp. P9-22]KAA0115725.1 ABC transporter [Mycolicibacterium sp. P9-22]
MNAPAILTARVLSRNRVDLIFAAVAPLLGLVGLTFLLRGVIDTGEMSYAQYVLPAVVVQAMLFGALTTTDRAAMEKSTGLGTRLRTLPISPYSSLIARMNYCLIRGVIGITASLIAAAVFGFSFDTGFWYTTAFFALALILTLALSLGADATGTKAGRTEVASQLLMVPQLLLVLLSTGVAPLQSFPTWLQPAVRWQPISQITETLRGFTIGQVDTGNLLTSLAWCTTLLIAFGWVALRLQRRTK